MSCYKEGDLIRIPQDTWLFNQESLHNSLLYPKIITNEPYIGCVLTTEKAGELLKVFIKNEYFLVKSKDVFFAKEMTNAS
tara:strand:+ start:554 stop:793 length:240 start_codon:yes stop_codon:yes gene_type:complete